MRHLVLVGFMGSGKTTLASYLASRFHLSIFSTDERIRIKMQMEISEIFSRFGEPLFRLEEYKIFNEIQALREPHIIDCGGGFGAYQEVNKLGGVVFLDIAFDEIVRRLQGDQTRPLLNEKVKELFVKRREMYQQKADLILQQRQIQSLDCFLDQLEAMFEEN